MIDHTVNEFPFCSLHSEFASLYAIVEWSWNMVHNLYYGTYILTINILHFIFRLKLFNSGFPIFPPLLVGREKAKEYKYSI